MRTLAKPQKQNNNKQKQENAQANQKQQGKNVSKKVTKTIFHTPFRYKIQTLNVQDAENAISLIINFAKALRSQKGEFIKPVKNEKFISFNSKVIPTKPPLSTQQFIYGVKQIIRDVKSQQSKIKLSVLFYDQNKHDKLQQLMCSLLHKKAPYIILRQQQKLKEQLGLKQLLALGITHEELSNELLRFSSKCLIEIPWLIDAKWIPLK